MTRCRGSQNGDGHLTLLLPGTLFQSKQQQFSKFPLEDGSLLSTVLQANVGESLELKDTYSKAFNIQCCVHLILHYMIIWHFD